MSLPFDLQPLEDFARAIMVNTCRITRDTLGNEDDTLDQTTGQLTPVADQTLVYAGVCSVQYVPVLRPVAVGGEGGRDLAPSRFRIDVPLDAPVARYGDIVEIVTAPTDPALAGRKFKVETVAASTLAVRRQLLCMDQW